MRHLIEDNFLLSIREYDFSYSSWNKILIENKNEDNCGKYSENRCKNETGSDEMITKCIVSLLHQKYHRSSKKRIENDLNNRSQKSRNSCKSELNK